MLQFCLDKNTICILEKLLYILFFNGFSIDRDYA